MLVNTKLSLAVLMSLFGCFQIAFAQTPVIAPINVATPTSTTTPTPIPTAIPSKEVKIPTSPSSPITADPQKVSPSIAATPSDRTPVVLVKPQLIPTAIPTQPAASLPPSAATTTQYQQGLQQLELVFDKDARCEVFSLPQPPRIVVDVGGAITTSEFDRTSFANTFVKNIRTGKQKNGTFRIVFDLTEPLSFVVSKTTGNSADVMKLVISLSRKQTQQK